MGGILTVYLIPWERDNTNSPPGQCVHGSNMQFGNIGCLPLISGESFAIRVLSDANWNENTTIWGK